jgi:hypothetical protein
MIGRRLGFVVEARYTGKIAMDDFRDWLRENPMPDLQGMIENVSRRLAADRGEPYDPVKHHPGWEQITAVHDEFDRAVADWRRRYLDWQQRYYGQHRG